MQAALPWIGPTSDLDVIIEFLESATSAPLAGAAARSPKLRIEYVAADFGERILGASDLKDLSARVDQVIEDPAFWKAMALFSPIPSTVAGAGRAPNWDAVADRISLGIGRSHFRQLQKGFRFLVEVQRITQLIAQATAEQERAGTQNRTAGGTSQSYAAQLAANPLAFLSDPTIHSEVAKHLLDGFRGVALTFAVLQLAVRSGVLQQAKAEKAHPTVHRLLSFVRRVAKLGIFPRPRGSRSAPWLTQGILEQWVAGLRAFVRLYASYPVMNVSEQLIPMSERIDTQRLDAELAARERLFAEVAARDVAVD